MFFFNNKCQGVLDQIAPLQKGDRSTFSDAIAVNMVNIGDEDAPQDICNIIIPTGGDVLCCDDFCQKWFQPTTKISDLIKWYFASCAEKSDKVVNQIDDF